VRIAFWCRIGKSAHHRGHWVTQGKPVFLCDFCG